jgi:hypothetical protein
VVAANMNGHSDNAAYSDANRDLQPYQNIRFIFNHFLTAPPADVTLAEQVNHKPFFFDQAQACSEQMSDLPNFVMVDFYTTGVCSR